MGIVHQVHRGSSPEGVMLYAGVWGRQHDRNDDVQVRSAPLSVRETSGHAWPGSTYASQHVLHCDCLPCLVLCTVPLGSTKLHVYWLCGNHGVDMPAGICTLDCSNSQSHVIPCTGVSLVLWVPDSWAPHRDSKTIQCVSCTGVMQATLIWPDCSCCFRTKTNMGSR